MFLEPNPADKPGKNLPASGTSWCRITPRNTTALALILVPLLVMHVRAAQTPLPGCNQAVTHKAIGEAIEAIPALSGRGTQFLALENVASRGAKGDRRLRACQAWLVTDKGAGTLEYSIRESNRRNENFRVKPELFQGGWHDVVVQQDALAGQPGTLPQVN